MAAPQKITAWSYSRWSTYEDCPLKAKYKFVDKLSEPGSAAMDRGIHFHKVAEIYATSPKVPTAKTIDDLALTYEDKQGKTNRVTLKDLTPIIADLKEARKGRPIAEQEWSFTSNWEPTGWFSKDAWCRIKTDLVFAKDDHLVIVDHKTGKRNENAHKSQLSLYALGGFIKYPMIDKIRTEVWYIDQGRPYPNEVYERHELEDIKAAWEDKTRRMLNDTQFAPRPSNSCRWCHFRKSNGGPCDF